MNSCLYECSVAHRRLAPKVHHFAHDLFMFWLDLDELEVLARDLWLFGYNRKNIYSFCDDDHEPAGPNPLKARLIAYLWRHGIDLGPHNRVMLLTLPRVFGYIFNPISVYYCFNGAGAPVCAVVEVGNTFREMKLFLLRREDLGAGGEFGKIVPKHFYVSPFSSLELNFDFRLKIPGEKLEIKIDDRDGAAKVLISTLTGRQPNFTQPHGQPCQAIQHQQHMLALGPEKLRYRGSAVSAMHPPQSRIIGRRGNHHAPRPRRP